MPQLTLEVTANLPDFDATALFASLHAVLTAEGIPLPNCKSRWVKRSEYFIADGQAAHAFAHLELQFLEGRSEEVRRRIGTAMLEALVATFGQVSGLDVQVTVHITDMRRDSYFKYPGGTLGPE